MYLLTFNTCIIHKWYFVDVLIFSSTLYQTCLHFVYLFIYGRCSFVFFLQKSFTFFCISNLLPIIEHTWWRLFQNRFVHTFHQTYYILNLIGGVMISVVDRGFEPHLGQTKDNSIFISCFSAKHAALRRKSKDWFARNQNSLSEWSDMSTRGLLFQWAITITIQLSVLV